MAIYSMHVVDRGFGDAAGDNVAQLLAAGRSLSPDFVARMTSQTAQTVADPGALLSQSLAPSPGPATVVSGDFFEQYGIPIAAGVTAFVAGLALAKFATSRKKRR